MLPPPPATALREANPHFALLYDHLITNILNNDGSTRSTNAEHESITKNLNEARRAILRDAILLCALEEIAMFNEGSPESLPTDMTHPWTKTPILLRELQNLILNITSYLSASLDPEAVGYLPPDTHDLMAEELETFYAHLPEISRNLSTHLTDIESDLTALAASLSHSTTEPTPNPSLTGAAYNTRKYREHNTSASVPSPSISLSESLTALTTSTSTAQQTALPALLGETTQSVNKLLSVHAQHLHRTIRHLELIVHGNNARNLTSRSAYLHAVARGMELKAQTLRLEKEKALYTDENLLDRMGEEYDELRIQERKLANRERDLRELLDEYEIAGQEAVVRSGVRGQQGQQQQRHGEVGTGEDVFRVLGARYAEIEEELDVVKADVERLEEKWLRPRESRMQ